MQELGVLGVQHRDLIQLLCVQILHPLGAEFGNFGRICGRALTNSRASKRLAAGTPSPRKGRRSQYKNDKRNPDMDWYSAKIHFEPPETF
jgi:hypothetical protein